MSRGDATGKHEPEWWQTRLAAAETAAPHAHVVVFVAGAGAATAPGAADQAGGTDFWETARRRLEDQGYDLELLDGADDPDATDAQASTWPALDPVPRASPAAPHPVRVKLRRHHPEAAGSTEAPADLLQPATRLGLVVCTDPEYEAAADAVAAAFEGVGYPCVRTASIAAAARALADRLLAGQRTAASPMAAPFHSSPPASESPTPSPWKPVLLVPLVGLLVWHSINPWLRGVVEKRFQLPGFSYDFVTADTVPVVAPVVVGVPTLVALGVFTLLRRWTGVDPPRWAAWTMLFPVLTTVFFTLRFFAEGSIISTHSEVIHSRGLGMLVETIGIDAGFDDHFRYRRPAGHNYSHTIYPFWEPWAILLSGALAAILGLRFAWAGRRHRPD